MKNTQAAIDEKCHVIAYFSVPILPATQIIKKHCRRNKEKQPYNPFKYFFLFCFHRLHLSKIPFTDSPIPILISYHFRTIKSNRCKCKNTPLHSSLCKEVSHIQRIFTRPSYAIHTVRHRHPQADPVFSAGSSHPAHRRVPHRSGGSWQHRLLPWGCPLFPGLRGQH